MRVTAKVASEVAKFDVALEHVPEFSAQVGVLISCFALVEEYVPHLVAKLTAMPHNDAWIIVNSYQSFSHRIKLLDELVGSGAHPTDLAPYRHFVSTLSAANAIRNRYAHARYSTGMRDETGRREVILQEFPSDVKKKPRSRHMKLKHVAADVKEIKQIICDLHAFVYRGELPLTP